MRRTLLPAFIALLLTGCAGEKRVAEAPVQRLLPGSKVIGRSMEGRPMELLKLGNGPDVVLMLATIHGNENVGTQLVQWLSEHLQSHPDLLRERTVAIVPMINPDGFARNKRENLRRVDLNRNFAAANRENRERYGKTGLTEPESQVINKLLQELKPSRIVSIHQPLDCLDYDGPADELAKKMAAECRLPVKKLGSRPGSLGSYAGVDLAIPIITMELPREATTHSHAELWRGYGQALLAAVVYPDKLR